VVCLLTNNAIADDPRWPQSHPPATKPPIFYGSSLYHRNGWS